MNEEESIKIYEYFNDIGIVDYDNINLFLNIYSDILKNKSYKNKDELLKRSLFSYMKVISNDENKLYEYSNRVINSFKNNQIISKYKSMKIIKTILYFKLRNILSQFIFNLITRKKRINQRNLNSKFPKSNIQKLNVKNNNTQPNKKNYFSIIQKEEEECTFSPRINNNFQLYKKKPIQTTKHNSPLSSKISTKNSTQLNKNENSFSNNNKNINNIISFNNIDNKKKFFTIEPNNLNNSFKEKYDFYQNEEKHLERVNDKILKMKMNKNINLEKDCTFKPKINKNYKLKKTNSESKIYINKTSNNSKINNKLNEENNSYSQTREKSDSKYYEKLYNDAQFYKEKEIKYEKIENEKYTFSPKLFKNNNYIVKMTFNERRNKSIENKMKLLKKKDDEEKQFLEEMKKNSVSKNKNVNNKEVINRLYEKEYLKIKERLEKEKKEKELQNQKKKNYNLDKNENNNNNNINDNNTITFGNNISKNNNLVLNFKKKYDKKDEALNLEEKGNNYSNNKLNIEQELLLMEKIKSEHYINFKNKKETKRNNQSNFMKKNYIEIQSLSSDANSIANASISKYNENPYK